MDLGLDGKICFITGSTKGVGYRIAQLLKDEGCTTILNSRSVGVDFNLDGFDYISGDVELKSECLKLREEIKKKYNQINILVCNVGSGKGSRPGEECIDEWSSSFNKNFYSAIYVIDALKDIISPGGSVICISSLCGVRVTGAPIPYSVAKSALNAYVKNSAVVFANKNIRVNALALGNILHATSVWAEKVKLNQQSVESYLKTNVPMARLGTLDEAAGMAVFLASKYASFITGTVISIDGGESL